MRDRLSSNCSWMVSHISIGRFVIGLVALVVFVYEGIRQMYRAKHVDRLEERRKDSLGHGRQNSQEANAIDRLEYDHIRYYFILEGNIRSLLTMSNTHRQPLN